tara:strand:+ start:285 stop:992 length:708 start_codon:yes stop_codon:yes gene_type:complete
VKKLLFYTTIKGVEKTMPIIASKEYKHSWIKKAMNNELSKNVTKCPGIFKIKNEGWLIRTWQDIKLSINGSSYHWETPINQKKLSTHFECDQIEHHGEIFLYNHFDNWPANTFSKVIKITTPWVVDIPKGYSLHQMHPAYLDENRFTTLPGIYTSETGLNCLNVPVLWHATKGEFIIKAGTPIAQLVLSKKEDIHYKTLVANESKQFLVKERLTNLLLNMSFKRVYKNIKDFWNK